MLKIKLIEKLQSHIDTLQNELAEVRVKQICPKTSCFAGFFSTIKRAFHDEVAIKSDKIRALKDIKAKIESDYFKSPSEYVGYLYSQYQNNPRLHTSRVFNGLFNRTEKLLNEVNTYLFKQAKVQSIDKTQNFQFNL